MKEFADEKTTVQTHTIKAFKNCIKVALMAKQSAGSTAEWQPDNFRLCTQIATRKSPRTDLNCIPSNNELDPIFEHTND